MSYMNILFLLSFIFCTVSSLHYRGTYRSYAEYSGWNVCRNASLSFQFKTTQVEGLLLYVHDGGAYDFIEVMHASGRVKLIINIVDGRDGHVMIVSGYDVNDGEWHDVKLTRNRMQVLLTVDGVTDSRIAFGSDYHFGYPSSTISHSDILNHNNSNYPRGEGGIYPLYFGGVPAEYETNLHGMSLPSTLYQPRFIGEIRNVMYSNCTCKMTRARHQVAVDVIDSPRESCDLENPCQTGCICVSGDDRETRCDCTKQKCGSGKNMTTSSISM